LHYLPINDPAQQGIHRAPSLEGMEKRADFDIKIHPHPAPSYLKEHVRENRKVFLQ
jgi:hypothetical protein